LGHGSLGIQALKISGLNIAPIMNNNPKGIAKGPNTSPPHQFW